MPDRLTAPPFRTRPILFAYGFRPFFLLAGLWAVTPVLVLWWSITSGHWPIDVGTPQAWHAHELLFGFVAAAIAGFLLTAVPNWTTTPAVSGFPLAALVLLWLSGRIAWAPVPDTNVLALQIAGLAFLPALGLMIAVPLLRSGNVRNLPFLIFLVLLFAADCVLHSERFGWHIALPVDGVLLAVNVIMILVVIIGGRIVPAFTRNALRRLQRPSSIAPAPYLDTACIATAAAVLIIDVAAPGGTAAGTAAAAAAVLLAARLGRWQGWRTLDVPLLWVLHAGCAWLVLGLVLKAAWLLAGAPWAVNWLHALTAGAFGTMILGVTTRATLGHTGRPLQASTLTTAAYLLVTLAAVTRVFGPLSAPAHYLAVLTAASCLWVGAYTLYLLVYAPMLLRPRADGGPG